MANPLLEGLHTIIAVSGTWIDVNVPFSSITNVNIDGVINYANQQKVVTYNITTITNLRVFNGAFTWVDWVTYNFTDYTLDGVTKQWLTNQPKTDFYCTLGQDLFLNARAVVGKKIYFENNDGELFSKNVVNNDSIVSVAVAVSYTHLTLPTKRIV